MQWYAVYVRSRSEKKVSIDLEQNGIESFVPLQRKLRQWSDRKKWVETPIISGYVFVHIDSFQYDQVLKNDNVVTYICFEGKAAAIRDIQIEMMKRMLEQSEIDVTLTREELCPGEKVEITEGPLTGLEGELIQFNGKKRVTLRISEINCNLMVAVSLDILKKKS